MLPRYYDSRAAAAADDVDAQLSCKMGTVGQHCSVPWMHQLELTKLSGRTTGCGLASPIQACETSSKVMFDATAIL